MKKYGLLLVLALALLSCTKEKQELSIQKIMPSDCSESSGCSWNGSQVEMDGYLSFVSKITGTLAFELAITDLYNYSILDENNVTYPKLYVRSQKLDLIKVGGVECPVEKTLYEVKVNKDDIIKFSGKNVTVYDIKIIAESYQEGDGDDF